MCSHTHAFMHSHVFTHVFMHVCKCSVVEEGDQPQGTVQDTDTSLSPIPRGLPGLPAVLHGYFIRPSSVPGQWVGDRSPSTTFPASSRDWFSAPSSPQLHKALRGLQSRLHTYFISSHLCGICRGPKVCARPPVPNLYVEILAPQVVVAELGPSMRS